MAKYLTKTFPGERTYPLLFQIFTKLPLGTLYTRSITPRVFILLTPGHRQIQIYTSQLPVTSISPSRSPRAETHDIEMAPKKDKSKVEDEAVVNLSTGWRKSKISQAAVQELENMGLL